MFTPIHTLLGGFLLHIASSSLLSGLGRVFGGSGIIDAALFGDRAGWRWALLGGMVGAPALNRLAGLEGLWSVHGLAGAGAAEPVQAVVRGTAGMVAAGLLVGAGSKLGSGCTSGHFLCGFSRLSPRSIVATLTFFTTAVVTAYASRGPVDIAPGVVPSYTAVYPAKGEIARLLFLCAWQYGLSVLLVRAARSASLRNTAEKPSRSSPLASLGARILLAAFTGYTFATGLQLSGMASATKVLRFLHLPIPGVFDLREWDPSLLFVVLGGIVPNGMHFATRVKPELEDREQHSGPKSQRTPTKYYVPTGQAARNIDAKLVGGAALFGVGWGLTGLCLLPSVVGLGSMLAGGRETASAGARGLVVFSGAMVAGMAGVRALGA